MNKFRCKYGIWMKQQDDLVAGWWNGIGQRTNEQYYRTDDLDEADLFDTRPDAMQFVREFRSLGYKCKTKLV
jgi:hypothetical protein